MFKPYHIRHEQLAHQAAHAAMLSDWQREEWTRQQKLKMERRKILAVYSARIKKKETGK